MAPNALRTVRLVLWALVVIIGVAATIVYLFFPPERPSGVFGGEFSLQSTQGGTFTDKDLSGTPSLLFYGFTFCPDVCPTTLAEATGWRRSLGLGPDDLRIIFISVDPERDTLAALETYLSAFGGEIIGLRGTLEQTQAAKDAFGAFSEKVEDTSSSEYLVNHTASVFLVDGDGTFAGTIAYGEDRDTALKKIARLVGR